MKKRRINGRARYFLLAVPLLIICLLFFAHGVAAPASKVIIIGLDAAEWDLINPLIEKGLLPNIAEIVANGTTGKLETFELSSSPVVWTTIATGVTRDVHGIEGFTVPDQGNVPYSTHMRKVPAMWNIVSHYGKRAGIIGHWVSWPAEEINGDIVSSFVGYDAEESKRIFHKGKLRPGEMLPGQTYPPELFDLIENDIVTTEMIGRADLEPFFEITDWNDPDLYFKPDGSENVLKESLEYVLPWTYAADLTNINIYRHLRDTQPAYDLTYVYLESVDVSCHRFWQFHDAEFLTEAMEFWGYDQAAKEKYIAMFGETIERYYIWADEFIGSVMADLGPEDTLLVVSDHGFGRHYNPEGYETGLERLTFSGAHGHFGVIMFYGANVRKGHRLENKPPDLTDVLPTVLTFMKVPVARWMMGRPISQAFSPRFDATYNTQYVDSYGIEGGYSQGHDSPQVFLDPEYERRMRALGYIQ